MKVYLTYDPSANYDNLINNKILTVLKQIPGEIDFSFLNPISTRSLERFNSTLNTQQSSKYTFDYFDKLIEEYRTQNDNIEDIDFVVLLSEKNNDKNFASTFKNKNIYIRTTHWDKYINGTIEYIICQQIVENLFDSLIEINVNNIKDDPNIHLFPTGCLNDLCRNKYHYVLKIRTAYICNDCIDRYLETNNKSNILIHIQHILTRIRDEFSNYDRIPKHESIEKVIITNNYDIYIGTKKIDLHPLPKALFVLALTQNRKTLFNKFDTLAVKKELLKIYEKIDQSATMDSINRLCTSISVKDGYFRKVINTINSELNRKLGNELSFPFKIIGTGNHLRLNSLVEYVLK